MVQILPNDNIIIDERLYKFTHRANNGNFCFKDPSEGNTVELSESNLLAKFMKGEIKLRVPADPDPSIDQCNLDIASVPARHRKEAEDRLAYIRAIYAAGTPRPMASTWPKIIEEVAADHGATKVTQWTTVRRWMRKYESSGYDIRSLLPSFARRGCKQTHLSTEERAFLNELILKLYMVKSRPTVKWLHGAISAEYREIQKVRPDACLWKIPSRSSIYRRIAKIDAYELDRARFGKRIADHKYRMVGRGRAAAYRLEVVEIDHTTANVIVVDEVHKAVMGRPTITIAIDRFTRMIVGLYIGFEPPSTLSVMQCLRNMILPKTYVDTEFPKIGIPWKAFGIPVSVVVDNAFEFRSDAFREVAAVLNFDISQQPVRQPEFKGIVERFMRTIELKAMTGLPGRTFSNPMEKGDYDPQKMACVTLRELREHFHHWMLAEYCYQVHDGILDVPARRWDEEVAREPVRLPMSQNDIDLYLGIIRTGTLRREGIRFANLFYNSPELNQVLRTVGNNRTVKFTIDANDISEIVVTHPIKHVPIRAFCTYREYASGLTLHQHRAIRAMRRKQGKELTNQPQYVAARDAFHRAAAQLLMRSDTRRRARLARHDGGANVVQPATELELDVVEKLLMSPDADADLETFLSQDTAVGDQTGSPVTTDPDNNDTLARHDEISANVDPDDELTPLPFRDRAPPAGDFSNPDASKD